MHRFKCYNGPMPTTAIQASVTTGTAIKTMLQISTPSTRQMTLISWGYTIDGLPTVASHVELIQTDVAATVTAHIASGVQNLDPNGPASLVTLGVGNTGYTGSAEGAITAVRTFDTKKIPVTTAGSDTVTYAYQWMPDERPVIAVSRFLRVRAHFGSAHNMICWVVWDE